MGSNLIPIIRGGGGLVTVLREAARLDGRLVAEERAQDGVVALGHVKQYQYNIE